MDTERRRYGRLQIQQCVKLSMGHETFITADIINISLGGIMCQTNSPVYDYEKMFFMIDLPLEKGTETIKVEGTIVHIQEVPGGFQFGVLFTDFFPGAKNAFERFLSNPE